MTIHNTLGDVHNLLMEELERLNDADGDTVDVECKRAHAITGIASQVVANAQIMLSACRMRNAMTGGDMVPKMLTGGGNDA